MISSFCANPCIDRRVEVDSFLYGGMNRIRSIRESGSGKGVNVALAAAELGSPSACALVLAETGGEGVTDRLQQAGCRIEAMRCAGRVRTNLKIFDQSNGVITEVNEPGAPANEAEVKEAIDLAVGLAMESLWMVLTGSVPPGFPQDCYAQLIKSIQRQAPQCKVVLDAEGELLRLGLAEKPDLIKPNRYELEMLLGRKLPAINDIHQAAMTLVEKGVRIVAVSLGSKGAYITDGQQSFFAPPLPIPVRSTVGAGDSMVVGLLLAEGQGGSLREMFRCGVAAAAACVSNDGDWLLRRARYEALLNQVKMERVI